jgi:SecD/SecF fusion protein
VYYHFAGLVADIAVVLNVLMTVALMILIKAAFTLPGLAGLVLTVGMAVDANVLIYERIREELERGASLRMAIRNGFSRATGTILDSNITTLITAIVLYVIGTDQIKGFAVTLILGLLVSMFTAIYVSRVILDIVERKRWIERLTMMKFFGTPKFEYIRYCIPAIAVSSVIVAAGVAAMVSRGKELLDIDFTGGSSVQIEFAEGKAQPIAEVRSAVAELPDVAVSSVGEEGQEFKIDTSDREIANVQKFLKEKFAGHLKTYSMSHGELAKIEATAPAATETPAASETPATGETPAEKPASEPAPEAPAAEAPAAAEKPAEAAPAETPTESAPAKPAEDTPADKPAESTAPQPEESSSRRVRNPFRFASYLQEEKAPEAEPAETPAEPAAVAPTAEEPAAEAAPAEKAPAETAAEAPATEAPANADAATDAKAAETPAKKEEATEAASTPAETEGVPVEAPMTAPADMSLTGGTRVELTFPEPIAHDPLAELVQGRLDSLGLGNTPFRLTNPEYQDGSEARYGTWGLESLLDFEQTNKLLEAMTTELATTPVFASSSQIGGKVAGDTQMMALYAMLASMVMIVLYVWIRFQNLFFGLAAVVALVHDVMISIAALALSAYLSPFMGALLVDPFKISLAVVAALLTIVGFSINDTIVIFDRIREVRGKSPRATADMINLSINQTLSRTIITSGTVFIACLILYFVGGPGIHAFAYTMVIGVIAGTYSTIYIAAPLILWLQPAPDQPTSKRDLTAAGQSR